MNGSEKIETKLIKSDHTKTFIGKGTSYKLYNVPMDILGFTGGTDLSRNWFATFKLLKYTLLKTSLNSVAETFEIFGKNRLKIHVKKPLVRANCVHVY